MDRDRTGFSGQSTLDRGPEAPDLVPDVRSERRVGLEAESEDRMILMGVLKYS